MTEKEFVAHLAVAEAFMESLKEFPWAALEEYANKLPRFSQDRMRYSKVWAMYLEGCT